MNEELYLINKDGNDLELMLKISFNKENRIKEYFYKVLILHSKNSINISIIDNMIKYISSNFNTYSREFYDKFNNARLSSEKTKNILNIIKPHFINFIMSLDDPKYLEQKETIKSLLENKSQLKK